MQSLILIRRRGWSGRIASLPLFWVSFFLSSFLPFFLPARCDKRGICYGNVAGWLGDWVSVTRRGIVSKQLNLS